MNDHQRITIVIDVPDMPSNDTVAFSGQFLCPLRGRDASVKMVASEPVTPSRSWS